MNTWRLSLAALVVVATVGRAEVRLVDGAQGPELAIRPAARGIWTPIAAADAQTINPGGDLLGDGYPAHDTAASRLLAAWQRPATSKLVVFLADASGRTQTVEVPTEPGSGIPVIAERDGGWMVAWQAGIVEPVVKVVFVDESGVGEPIPISPGEIVGLLEVGAALHVVSASRLSNTVTIVTYPGFHDPSPIPIPIPVQRTLQMMGDAAPARAGNARSVPGGGDLAAPWAPCVQVRGQDTLLAWQAGHGLVGHAVLEQDGVDADDTFLRGPNGSCTALLNAAARY